MKMTKMESEIIQSLQKKKVETIKNILKKFQVSRRTVHRALWKYGYYSSINFNSAYVTLKETPEFDKQRLWFYRNICFSINITLERTIKFLVSGSSSGLAVKELEGLLHTRVHNILSKLIRKGCLKRFYMGRNTIYVSSDKQIGDQQKDKRKQEHADDHKICSEIDKKGDVVPDGFDVLIIIRVLIQMIKEPDARPKQLAQKLQSQNVIIDEHQIRRITDYYLLSKKSNFSSYSTDK